MSIENSSENSDTLVISAETQIKTVESNPTTLSKDLYELEQYLNNDIATEIYKKFKVGFRVHLHLYVKREKEKV